jgi:protein SCO1/2
MPTLSLSRRGLLAAGLLVFCGGRARAWHSTEIGGALPELDFQMTRASDGKLVGAADFRGKVVLLYFGYTFCPDACPTALLNISEMLKALGPRADDVRVLFVTVDPSRDTLDVLKEYSGSFAPQVVGLRGTPDQLAALAKRYRVSYSVEPAPGGHGFEVTHSSGIYVFDRGGEARLLFTGLALPNAPIEPALADLRDLVTRGPNGSWWHRLLGWL